MNRVIRWALPFVLAFGCANPPVDSHGDEHGHESAEHTEDHVSLSDEALKIAGVRTAVAQRRLVGETKDVAGTVGPVDSERAVVTPPVSGRVTELAVRLGDDVRRGQTLVVLESAELAASWANVAEATKARDVAKSDVRQAQSEVALALAKLQASRQSLDRQRGLAKAGAFSQVSLQQAQLALTEAQSELLSAQKEASSHSDHLRRLESLFKEGIVSRSELDAARLEVQQDDIRTERAQSRIESAKLAFDREKGIASRGLLDARELQSAEAEVRTSRLEWQRAKLRVAAAEAALASAGISIANAESSYRSNSGGGKASNSRISLDSPLSGTVTRLDVTRGQAVERTQAILEIENLGSVWITANVPEALVARVPKGTKVEVDGPGFTATGVVQVVGSRIDAKTRTVPVHCLTDNRLRQLKSGAYVSVRIPVGRPVSSIVVPKTATFTEDKQAFLFVKEGEGFERRAVELGAVTGDWVVIRSGLKEGETVAAEGAFILSSELKKEELKGHDH
jgi:RND family efflux transporter MFP subunit